MQSVRVDVDKGLRPIYVRTRKLSKTLQGITAQRLYSHHFLHGAHHLPFDKAADVPRTGNPLQSTMQLQHSQLGQATRAAVQASTLRPRHLYTIHAMNPLSPNWAIVFCSLTFYKVHYQGLSPMTSMGNWIGSWWLAASYDPSTIGFQNRSPTPQLASWRGFWRFHVASKSPRFSLQRCSLHKQVQSLKPQSASLSEPQFAQVQPLKPQRAHSSGSRSNTVGLVAAVPDDRSSSGSRSSKRSTSKS